MDVKFEINTLAAETLALQTLLSNVLEALALVSPEFDRAIRDGFDKTANDVEDLAIRMGKSASPDHTVKALQIVETLRTITLRRKK